MDQKPLSLLEKAKIIDRTVSSDKISIDKKRYLWYKYLFEDKTISIRNQLAELYFGMVPWVIAQAVGAKFSEDCDLVQEGRLAVQGAIKRFKPEFGVAFVTFATVTIGGLVKRSLKKTSEQINIPFGVIKNINKMLWAADNFSCIHERQPTVLDAQEIADIMNRRNETTKDETVFTAETVIDLMEVNQNRYLRELDAQVNSNTDDSATVLVELIPSDARTEPTDSEFDYLLVIEAFKELSELGSKYVAVIVGRMNKTLEEVGLELGITRERVRQIEQKAMMKLRKIIEQRIKCDRGLKSLNKDNGPRISVKKQSTHTQLSNFERNELVRYVLDNFNNPDIPLPENEVKGKNYQEESLAAPLNPNKRRKLLEEVQELLIEQERGETMVATMNQTTGEQMLEGGDEMIKLSPQEARFAISIWPYIPIDHSIKLNPERVAEKMSISDSNFDYLLKQLCRKNAIEMLGGCSIRKCGGRIKINNPKGESELFPGIPFHSEPDHIYDLNELSVRLEQSIRKDANPPKDPANPAPSPVSIGQALAKQAVIIWAHINENNFTKLSCKDMVDAGACGSNSFYMNMKDLADKGVIISRDGKHQRANNLIRISNPNADIPFLPGITINSDKETVYDLNELATLWLEAVTTPVAEPEPTLAATDGPVCPADPVETTDEAQALANIARELLENAEPILGPGGHEEMTDLVVNSGDIQDPIATNVLEGETFEEKMDSVLAPIPRPTSEESLAESIAGMDGNEEGEEEFQLPNFNPNITGLQITPQQDGSLIIVDYHSAPNETKENEEAGDPFDAVINVMDCEVRILSEEILKLEMARDEILNSRQGVIAAKEAVGRARKFKIAE